MAEDFVDLILKIKHLPTTVVNHETLIRTMYARLLKTIGVIYLSVPMAWGLFSLILTQKSTQLLKDILPSGVVLSLALRQQRAMGRYSRNRVDSLSI
jgi:hypothetical protein